MGACVGCVDLADAKPRSSQAPHVPLATSKVGSPENRGIRGVAPQGTIPLTPGCALWLEGSSVCLNCAHGVDCQGGQPLTPAITWKCHHHTHVFDMGSLQHLNGHNPRAEAATLVWTPHIAATKGVKPWEASRDARAWRL